MNDVAPMNEVGADLTVGRFPADVIGRLAGPSMVRPSNELKRSTEKVRCPPISPGWTQRYWSIEVRNVSQSTRGRCRPGRFPEISSFGLRRVKSQYAKPSPAIDPRKLRASVCSIVKHGWKNMPRSDAQIESGCTRMVPVGRVTRRVDPAPPAWIVPTTEPSALIRPAPVVPSKQV
jgi:hypothetical protein